MAKKIDMKTVLKLREESGAGVVKAKKILEENDGDYKKALEILRKEGFEKAEKRIERETLNGIIATYVHHSGKISSMVEVFCETDFVARNEIFQTLGKNIAMQLAFYEPKDLDDLKKQEFIKDPSKTIDDLVKEAMAKTGENVRIGKFYRLELGK